MPVEKLPNINRQLDQLKRIAANFDQEALNEGEAGFLKSRVDACVDAIFQAIPELPLLPEREYKSLQTKFQKVSHEFEKVFTPQNEKEFAALKKAHETLDSISENFVPQSSIFETFNPLASFIYADKDMDKALESVLTESEKLSRFLGSPEFREIGRYLHENMSDIVTKLEPNPLGGVSQYIRRSDSGLARSIQIFLPEGRSDVEDLIFVVQMKQHGRSGMLDFLQDWLPFQVVGAESEKLQIIGKGSYKFAKHSLTFPATALSEKGEIDLKKVIFSTTLTPRTQSKEYLSQSLIGIDLEQDDEYVEMHISMHTGLGLESVERDAKYLSMFQGPGILPLIGSSRYSGVYRMPAPSLYESWMGENEPLAVELTKISMVTVRCDGDLAYDPDRIFDLKEKKSLAQDIVAGIQTIHEKGHQHGDVKPDNILFKMEKGLARGYLVDFGFSRAWFVEEARMGTPSFMPIDESGKPIANQYYDAYATALSLLGLLTHRRVISPSTAAVKEYHAFRGLLKSFMENPEKLEAEAKKRAMFLDDLKASLYRNKMMWQDAEFLCDRDHLKEMFWNDALLDENPLAFAFVKVLYLQSIPDDELWTDKVMNRLFGEGKKPTKGGDLTVPLLKELLEQIQALESEDDINLDLLIA